MAEFKINDKVKYGLKEGNVEASDIVITGASRNFLKIKFNDNSEETLLSTKIIKIEDEQ